MTPDPGRPRYVGFSTKMYFGRARTAEWLDAVRRGLDDRPDLGSGGVVPFVLPPLPLLETASSALSGTPALVGAQTVSWGEGALTGEVSAALLAELGIALVEIGHAERREHFGETADVVRRKVAVSVAAGLRPLLCVGEPESWSAARAADHVVQQVLEAGGSVPGLLLAYEPLWAIGAAAPADPEHVDAVLRRVRDEVGADVPLLYGGSAGPGMFLRLEQSDGLFLGRFAHDPANFLTVLDEARSLAPDVS